MLNYFTDLTSFKQGQSHNLLKLSKYLMRVRFSAISGSLAVNLLIKEKIRVNISYN